MSAIYRFGQIVALALAVSAASTAASAQGPFTAFTGTWSGDGQVRLEGGKSEGIRCRAYYTQKPGPANVNLALRCASTSHKIEMRASLEANGSDVAGSWEERTFNATGNVAGKGTPNRLNLSITGGGLTGSMSITTSGSTQSIRISTEGTGFRGLTMRLSRG
jgi:hypothetical protein